MLAGDIVVAVLWRRDAAFASVVIENMMAASLQCTRQGSHVVEGILTRQLPPQFFPGSRRELICRV